MSGLSSIGIPTGGGREKPTTHCRGPRSYDVRRRIRKRGVFVLFHSQNLAALFNCPPRTSKRDVQPGNDTVGAVRCFKNELSNQEAPVSHFFPNDSEGVADI